MTFPGPELLDSKRTSGRIALTIDGLDPPAFDGVPIHYAAGRCPAGHDGLTRAVDQGGVACSTMRDEC